MRILIELQTDNAAFYDLDGNPDPGAELARILRRLANRFESYVEPHGGVIHDINGNDVGGWTVEPDALPDRLEQAPPQDAGEILERIRQYNNDFAIALDDSRPMVERSAALVRAFDFGNKEGGL